MRKYDARRLDVAQPRCQLEENSFLPLVNSTDSSLTHPHNSLRLSIITPRTRSNPVGYSDENRNAIGM